MKPIWIKLILVLLNVQEFANRRSDFFNRNVNVSVNPGNAESELEVFIGTLEILLTRRDDILQSLLTRNVGGVVMGHLTGSFYSGVVTEKQDCNVRQVKNMWLDVAFNTHKSVSCVTSHTVTSRIMFHTSTEDIL